MIQIKSSRELARQNGVKAVVYGRAGVGKTTLVTTAPSPLMISAESGLLSIRNHDIDVAEVSTIAEMQEVYDFLTSSEDASKYWTVYLDSISEIAEVVLANELEKSKDPRQAYGSLLSTVMRILKAFRDIPAKHVVLVAKQEALKDEVSKVTMYGPSMPGSKLGNAVPYIVDEVFRLGIGVTPEGQEYRFLQTQPDMQYEAKDRSGALEQFEEPNFEKIFNKIIG